MNERGAGGSPVAQSFALPCRSRSWFRCPASGRFGPSAQQPTGLTLPCAPAGVWGRAPNPCAAAQNASVSSGRRSQETRLPSNSYGRMTQPGAQRARRRKPPGRGRRDRGSGVRAAGRTGTSWRERWDGVRGFGVSGVTGTAGSERRDEPGHRDANTGTEREALARTA